MITDIKPGDLFKAKDYEEEENYGIVIQTTTKELFIIYSDFSFDNIQRSYNYIEWEFRRPRSGVLPLNYKNNHIKDAFDNGTPLFSKKPIVTELTLQEISDKFNIPLTNLRIKK